MGESNKIRAVVVNGSPKGRYSTTLQSSRYLEKKFKNIEFSFINAAVGIAGLRKGGSKLDQALDLMKQADLIIWSYPVYTFLVPAQLIEFSEIIRKNGAGDFLKGKYSVQILTSKHFFDTTAIEYMNNISQDFGMNVLRAFSADMDDLLTKEGQKELVYFGQELYRSVSSAIVVEPRFPADPGVSDFIFTADNVSDVKSSVTDVSGKNRIALITSSDGNDLSLENMINLFVSKVEAEVNIFRIPEMNLIGGCLGCFKCAFEGKCFYPDGFDDFHRNNILNADAIVYAGRIKDHWLGSEWKYFDDRQFYNGHRTSMMGKPVAYLLAGNLRDNQNLRQVLEYRADVGRLYLTGIVTDECEDNEKIASMISETALQTSQALVNTPTRPVTFAGIGGMKVFRDLIYKMRGLMQEDHRFYKKHKLYDFPHKDFKTVFKMKLIGLLLRIPGGREKMSKSMNQEILKMYEKIISSED